MTLKIIAVVGSKKSGKTTVVEALIEELTKRGYKVAAAKHVSEEDFTIDREGKDTWRFAKSGAKTIVTVASHEVTKIEKVNTSDFSLKDILHRCNDNDVVVLEGFRKLVAKDKNVHKIVTVKSAEEALEASKTFDPILAFSGLYSTENLNLKISYIDVLKNREKIVDLVEKIGKPKP